MTRSRQIKTTVQNLRAEGKTYTEIQSLLNIKLPKSTLSDWCKNIKLPVKFNDKIYRFNCNNLEKARKLALLKNKTKQQLLLKQLKIKNKNLAKNIKNRHLLKIILAVLYLTEGAKWKSHRGLMLGNTDPIIIKLYINLLKKCYNISSNDLKCRISYRADQNINTLEKYWSEITHIPLKDFYKTKPDPRTIGKPTRKKEYKGVCVITCKGTNIQLELEMIPKIILEGL